jgi:hypothetical protein
MKILLKSLVTLLFAVSGVTGAVAAPLTSSSEKNVLFITETVTASGAVNVSAKVGPLTTSEVGFGIDRLGSTAATGAVPAAMPAILFSAGYPTTTGRPTRGDVLDFANTQIRNNFSFLQQSMAAYLTSNGISSGWFNFKEEVLIDVNGVAETWTIHWDYFSDQNGRGAFADARLASPDPKTLYVVYTPKAVDKDLPAGWAYTSGAGTFKYQLRNMNFQPVTDWITVDVNGLYDTAQTETEYLDAGVSCLMDNANPGCTVGAVDVKRLLDATGAVLAVVDYVRRVEPVWQDMPDGTRIPVMGTSVDTRELTWNGCTTPTYRNAGSFGYTLSSSLGRYLASSSGSPRVVQFQQIQEYRDQYLSPTQNYDFSVIIPKTQVSTLGNLAIDPVKGPGVQMLASADIPGLTYFAPLNVVGSPVKNYGTFTSYPYAYGGGAQQFKVSLSLRCGASGDYEVITEQSMVNHNVSGAWYSLGSSVTRVTDNTWTSVNLAQHGTARYASYVDTANKQGRITEGQQQGTYPFIPGGTGYAYSHNGASMYAGVVSLPSTVQGCDEFTCGPRTVYSDYSAYFRGFDLITGAILYEYVAIYVEPCCSGGNF